MQKSIKCNCGQVSKILIVNKSIKTIDCPKCGIGQIKTKLFETQGCK